MTIGVIIRATPVIAVQGLAISHSIVEVISRMVVSVAASEAIQSAAVAFKNTFLFGVAVTSDISWKTFVGTVRVVIIN